MGLLRSIIFHLSRSFILLGLPQGPLVMGITLLLIHTSSRAVLFMHLQPQPHSWNQGAVELAMTSETILFNPVETG